MLISLNVLLLIVFAFFMGRFGWWRGVIAEVVTACGLLIAYFGYGIFIQILLWILNLLLGIASVVVGRVQGKPATEVNYAVNYDKLDSTWRLGLGVFAFIFLVLLSYIAGIRLVTNVGTPSKPHKSWRGAFLGVLNGFFMLATAFRIVGGAPDLSSINQALVIPTIDLRFRGTNENPLGTLTTWLPLLLVAVTFVMILSAWSRGLPKTTTTTVSVKPRTRVGLVVLIIAGFALVGALVLIFSRRA